MRLVLNIIWLLFGGLWLALGYALAALVCFLLIITIPFGFASLRIASYALWPFGRTIVEKPGPRPGVWTWLGRVCDADTHFRVGSVCEADTHFRVGSVCDDSEVCVKAQRLCFCPRVCVCVCVCVFVCLCVCVTGRAGR